MSTQHRPNKEKCGTWSCSNSDAIKAKKNVSFNHSPATVSINIKLYSVLLEIRRQTTVSIAFLRKIPDRPSRLLNTFPTYWAPDDRHFGHVSSGCAIHSAFCQNTRAHEHKHMKALQSATAYAGWSGPCGVIIFMTTHRRKEKLEKKPEM